MSAKKDISHTLTRRQLCNLEMLLSGAFAPLTTFLNEEDFYSVVETMRLANGQLWPMPIVFDVQSIVRISLGTKIILKDQFDKPLAVLEVSSIYKPNKRDKALKVYGTTDFAHPGVKNLFEKTGNYFLSGKLRQLHSIEHYDFPEYYCSPTELKKYIRDQGHQVVIGFQTRNPIHKAHYTLMTETAKKYKGTILIHPAVGETPAGDIDYVTRVRSYIRLQRKYMKKNSILSLLPLAMNMAGPRSALLHALIRKNYGCTHFIIGRKHADPGLDSNGNPFYEPYDAQQLVESLADEIGLKIISLPEVTYVEEENMHIFEKDLKPHHTSRNISGTKFRQMMLENESIPDWFSFPEVIEEVRRGIQKQNNKGLTIFFTGLPSAGKTTLAQRLYYKLLEIQDKSISVFDGDLVRKSLSAGLGFSKKDRIQNILRIGFVAKEITKHGGIAVCAAIAPYEEARRINRKSIEEVGHYVEVYVSTPLKVCQKRDVKDLYKKAGKGLVEKMTGVQDAYEIPQHADLVIDTEKMNPDEAVQAILDYLISKKYIKRSFTD